MCGICGIVSCDPLSEQNYDIIHLMNARMVHRGPDGEGEFHNSHLAMAMRRLSIIDLDGGWQPLYNEDRSLVLIVNGEIYNYVELRSRLMEKGHRFNTGSDCETILHLYEDYGAECVHHLRGMFSFALWDCKRKRLLLARDRMGEKPLYLYEQKGFLIFASELKALMSSDMVPFELDPQSVNLFFHYQYVPEPGTPIKGVRKLPAGHYMIVDIKSWNINEICYWRMEDVPQITGDPGKIIRAELEKISDIIIRSDVPVGVALSGGLDSSAITALAARKYPGIMHAFSVGYSGRPPSDEREDAAAYADYLDIPFHDVELSTKDMVSSFPEMVLWRDDPINDISGYGYYAVMKLARDHNVPVILQGQGGDELFWGYSWVKQSVLESKRKYKKCNAGNISIFDYIQPTLPRSHSPEGLLNWIMSLAGILDGLKSLKRDKVSPCSQLVFYDMILDFQMACKRAKDAYTTEFVRHLNGSSATVLFNYPQPWKQIDVLLTRLIYQTYLLENGMAQGERLSMASSVELRLPLLDYRLVEIVIGLRKSYSDYLLPPKAWLKQSLKDILPDWIMKRPKRGFEPPTKEWHQALFDAYGDKIEDGYLVQAGVLKSKESSELSAGPFSKRYFSPLSSKALVLEIWCRQYLGSNGSTY